MTLSLGLFDVFTYMIPGSFYLALVVYVGDRLRWIDIGHLKNVPSLILVGGILAASYVSGFVTNPLAASLDRSLRFWNGKYDRDTRAVFISRVPAAANRAYVQSDMFLLLAAAEASQKDAAQEISRLRAVGLMLRNCSPPLLIACAVSIVEAAKGNHLAVAAVSSTIFAALALSGIRQGKRIREWANMKTLEICYWIPGIDDLVQQRHVARKRLRQPTRGRTY